MKKLIPIIITIMFLGGCASFYKVSPEKITKMAQSINRMCPLQVDKWTTLTHVKTTDKTFHYFYTVTNDYDNEFLRVVRKEFKNPDLILSWEGICRLSKEIKKNESCQGETKKYMAYGDVKYHYYYKTKDEKHSFDFIISKESCELDEIDKAIDEALKQ